jgi:hypothetical protein
MYRDGAPNITVSFLGCKYFAGEDSLRCQAGVNILTAVRIVAQRTRHRIIRSRVIQSRQSYKFEDNVVNNMLASFSYRSSLTRRLRLVAVLVCDFCAIPNKLR